MKSIVILASGSGTNADNIARVFAEGSAIKVEALLTDRENAPVRAKMEALGIPVVYFPRKEWREQPGVIADFIKTNYHPDLVILAGFNSILKEEFVNAYEGRILNIHPSLLPKFGGPGMWGHNVHEAVLAAGEKESGVTVHIVTNEVDGGPIVLQETVPVLEGDTPETLEARIHQKEYSLFPRAIVKRLREMSADPVTDAQRDAVTVEVPETGTETVIETAEGEHEGEKVVTETQVTVPVPPPVSPDEQWADALGIPHKPEDFTGHAPGAPVTPPQTPGQPPAQPMAGGAQQAPFSQTPPQFGQSQFHAAPVQPAGPAMAATTPEERPVMPQTYMLWSILSLICCCLPAGIVAVIMSARVSSKYYEGDYEGAQRASRNAEIWIIVSFVLGVLVNTLYLPFALFFNL